MNRMSSATVFMIALMLLVGVLVFGTVSFLSKMNGNYILVQSGNQPIKQILSNHQYVQNKRGFIFSLTFLVVGVSLFIMIALPSEEAKTTERRVDEPQPVQPVREESSISAVIEKQPEVESDSEAVPDELKPEIISAAEVETEDKADPISIETITQAEVFSMETFDDITEGEDDVVYGSGPISDAAIMHFVHKFPDSALKYLVRKQLDGKSLTNVEENIYQGWEERQMSRGKVKGYILTLMDWKEFPKKPLYEIWKEIRDHIFENIEE